VPLKKQPVSRAEFERILRILDERKELIENLQHTCTIQFERIAQMQAQLDHLQRTLAKSPQRRR
jgi:hypothetical protein